MNKILITITSIVSTVAWIYALLERFASQDWVMFIIDIFIPPVGIIDGIGQYFGYW